MWLRYLNHVEGEFRFGCRWGRSVQMKFYRLMRSKLSTFSGVSFADSGFRRFHFQSLKSNFINFLRVIHHSWMRQAVYWACRLTSYFALKCFRTNPKLLLSLANQLSIVQMLLSVRITSKPNDSVTYISTTPSIHNDLFVYFYQNWSPFIKLSKYFFK